MADNTVLPGTGETYASKEVSTVKHQKVISEAESYGAYYPNIPDGGLVDGDISMNQANADGIQEIRAAVITDEGSVYYPIVGTSAPTDSTTAAGTGQSVAFANGQCVITLGNTANAEAYWSFPIDYAPIHAMVKLAINQRVANQDIYFEAADGATPSADTMFARFHWTGTTNTLVRCETQASADTNNSEGTAEDLTQASSATSQYYNIELGQSGVYFSYDVDPEIRLTRRIDKYPDIYTPLNFRIRGKNGATPPTNGTTITITVVKASNVNRVDVGTVFHDEALQVGISDTANAVTGDKEHNTAGSSTSAVETLPAIAKAAAPTYGEGNVVGLRTNLAGDLAVTLDGEAVVLGAGSAAIGKLTSNSGVDIGDVDILSIAAGDNNIGNVDIVSMPNEGQQTMANSISVAIASDQSAVPVAGNVAHGGSDSGNPVKIGGRSDTTFQAAVTDGQRVDALFDAYGLLFTRKDHPNRWSYHENSSSALTDASVQAAPGAGLSNYITDIVFSTGAATACNIFFEESTTTILGPYYLEAVAGRGLCIHFSQPHKCTANTAVTVTTSAAIAHGLDVKGFIAP